MDALVKSGLVDCIPSGTRALILERHIEKYRIREVNAAELRYLDGPRKGESGWVFESVTAVPAIDILTSQMAGRLANPVAKKKR
jgi:hypothetical protein